MTVEIRNRSWIFPDGRKRTDSSSVAAEFDGVLCADVSATFCRFITMP